MIFVLFITSFGIYLYLSIRRKSKELPGPFKWPILGNLPQIALVNWSRVWVSIDYYSKQYGGIYGMYFGPRYVVVLNDAQIAHEVLKLDEWNDRPNDDFAKIKGDGKVLGIIQADGDLWKETRRFTFRHLRNFGFGKASIMEMSILEEVQNVIERMEKDILKGDEIINSEETLFGPAILSTLWNMVAGSRTELDDPNIHKLLYIVQETLRRRPFGAGLFWSFPSLGKWFPQETGLSKQIEGFRALKDSMRRIIADHKTTRILGQSRDFIDAYLDENESNPDNPHFFDEQLVVTCMDLFVAGSDTTTVTLRFALLYLILHPDVQTKIQKEIDLIVGRDRSVSLQDKDKLIYFEAYLQEVNRYASVAPIVTPHALTETVFYKGYEIPKGSVVFINTWGIHRNKEHWVDPETFRPERFIDSNDQLISNDEWLMPFGSGKRKCPAELLGRTSIFLMMANLLQKFTFSIPPEDPEPTTLPIIGLSLSPQPFRALVQRRES